MLIAIRISGQVNIPTKIAEALFRLRLRKKYAATVLHETDHNRKLLEKLRNYIAFGSLGKEMLSELIKKRAKPLNSDGKVDSEKIIKDLEKKPLHKLEIKPFFSLHPPRRGIEAKKHFGVGKGVLGDHKDKIDDLVRRML